MPPQVTVHGCLVEPRKTSKFNHTSLVERAIKCFATADSCFKKKNNFYQSKDDKQTNAVIGTFKIS